MSAIPVQLLEGLFFESGTDLFVQTSAGDESVLDCLRASIGQVVSVSLHHLPPDPPIEAPGFGCCLWGEFCPVGHNERPDWLFQQHLQGLLSCSEGNWSVGGVPLEFGMLLGHLSRVLIVQKLSEETVGLGLEESRDTADQLKSILSALQTHMRKENG